MDISDPSFINITIAVFNRLFSEFLTEMIIGFQTFSKIILVHLYCGLVDLYVPNSVGIDQVVFLVFSTILST